MSFMGYGSPTGQSQYSSYPQTGSSQQPSYPTYGAPMAQDQFYRGSEQNYGGNAKNAPGSGYNTQFGGEIDRSNYRPMTVQGLGNIDRTGKYGATPFSFEQKALNPYETVMYDQHGGGKVTKVPLNVGAHYYQPNAGFKPGDNKNGAFNPLVQTFKDWKATGVDPYNPNGPYGKDANGKYGRLDPLTTVQNLRANNFDSLNNLIAHMDSGQLIEADKTKDQLFDSAAQQYANAFANKDWTAEVQRQQKIGLGLPHLYEAGNAEVNPALLYNQQNVANWLQNSYGQLMDRLNTAGLL